MLIGKVFSRISKEYRFFRGHKFGNLWNYLHGFTLQTSEICGINKSNYKEFLSDKDYRFGHPYNGAYSSIIDNKLYLPYLLHQYKAYIPKYYFFKDERGLHYIDSEDRTKIMATISDFFTVLHEQGELALKHTHLSLGKGFIKITFNHGNYFINLKQSSKEEVSRLVNSLDNYIITESVKQHQYSQKINSSSLNTLRFLCVWDDARKSFDVVRIFHRFGSNGQCVDNLAQGNGVCLFVDPQTGVLSNEGVVNINGTGDRYITGQIKHQQSGFILSGMKVPNFEEVKTKIIEISNSISFIRYIGYDVAITDEGFKIIETNSLSSLDFVQQRNGFLNDIRIRKVLKK